MSRRGRRSGVRFIEDDRDRSLTFFKRRGGLYKAAADLSTLTSARVAVVLESQSGKFSAFGTPAADPIVDAFLSGNAPIETYTSEEQKATITELQNELFQMERDITVEEKRKKDCIALEKELQESSRMAKYVFGKEEGLGVDELREMYREFSRFHQEIQHRLSALHHSGQQEVGGMRDPSLLQSAWWRSLPSQMLPPQRFFPWSPIQPFVQVPGLSLARPAQATSQSSLLSTRMLPSQQFPHRSMAPSMVQLQAQKMLVPKEVAPYNYHTWGVDINGNNSSPFFQTPVLPSPSPQIPLFNESSPHPSSRPQFSLPLPLDNQLAFKSQNHNSIELPQNYANAASTSVSPNKSYYASLGGQNVDLGNTGENGGQIGGSSNMFGYSGLVQGDGWADVMMSESSLARGSSGADAGNNLDDMNFPWN